MKSKKQKTGCEQELLPSYALVTPARNEASFIELTLRSMIEQTHLPLKWVIVSDGSTDGTDEIARRYAARFPWIELLRMPERTERHFAGKVKAFNAGYARLKDLKYQVIGNLDADISFDKDHFKFLLIRFAENPSLGVAGTAFTEGARAAYDYNFTNIRHVSGQCQLFRRECFEEIGGYLPRKIGGIDLVAVITARMKGWQTRTFPEKTFIHHKAMGSGMYKSFAVHVKQGQANYILGNHPVWEIFRDIYQMKNRPIFLRGFLNLAGFYWALLTRAKKDVPDDFVAFTRREQMDRLKNFFMNHLPFRMSSAKRI